MFGIKRFKKGVVTAALQLRNLEGNLVDMVAGERVNLLSLDDGSNQYFGIQNQAKGTMLLPLSLFANDFKLFERGM